MYLANVLTLACKVIRYRLLQTWVRQFQKRRLGLAAGLQLPFSISFIRFFNLFPFILKTKSACPDEVEKLACCKLVKIKKSSLCYGRISHDLNWPSNAIFFSPIAEGNQDIRDCFPFHPTETVRARSGNCWRLKMMVDGQTRYRKTPLISMYVFSGIATVQVRIFEGRTYFRGHDKAEWKGLQGRSLLIKSSAFRRQHAVVHVSAIMHICTLSGYWGTCIWGYVLLGDCSRQQMSVENEGYLFSEGVLMGLYGNVELVLSAICSWPSLIYAFLASLQNQRENWNKPQARHWNCHHAQLL